MDKRAFLNTIERFITANKLMSKGELYLTALSGGADSVALALSLKMLGYRVEAVHCNFHLRGEEADRDEEFCAKLCKAHDIPLHRVHFNTIDYAKLHKVSIEMAARNLRYAYFEQLRADINAQGICVGHHREDSVETVLINLIRGTGINGLTGIAARNGFILRPLLCVSRGDIEEFLATLGQDSVTDSTNLVDDVTRNKIRLNLMPLIRSINPSADKDIAATAMRLAEAAKVFNAATATATESVTQNSDGSRTTISIEKLKEQISPEYTLYNILSRFSFSPATIEDIHEKLDTVQTGRVFASATHRLVFDREQIIIEPMASDNKREMKIPECGNYVFDEQTKLKFDEQDIDANFHIERSKNTATLDASQIKFPLCIRHAKAGDWFIPFGMKGKKLISDFLTDRKYSVFDKERQLIVSDANDNILWVVGERSDNRYRVTANTKRVLVISKA